MGVCVCVRVCVSYVKDLVGLGYERATPLREVLDCFKAEDRLHQVHSNLYGFGGGGGRALVGHTVR